MKYTFIVILIILCSFIKPEIDKTEKQVLIITHPETLYIGSNLIKSDLMELIKNKNVKILVDSYDSELIFDIKGEKIISGAGEHNLCIKNVEFAGGYFGACLRNSILFWSENLQNKSGTATIYMKSVYAGQKRTLYDEFTDNYKSNEKDFLEWVSSFFKDIKNKKITIIDDKIIIEIK